MHICAVIFLPPGAPIDGPFARQCLEHIAREGYRLLTVAWEWQVAWSLLRSGDAQIIVVARGEHMDPCRVPRFEVAGHHPAADRPALVRRNQRQAADRPRQIRLPPA
jgi:hypothetical protein